MLSPSAGAVLRIPFGQISAVTEPQPFTVRITLADGNAIELSRLGVMRTQLLAELRDGRGDAAASAVAAVGDAAVFSARSGVDPAEVRVYDDALLVIGAAGSERISFSFVGAVQVRDYQVSVEVTGREPVILSQLGRRTDELGLLTDRLREARGRTAAFLASLLPGLDPMRCARRPGCCETAWPCRPGRWTVLPRSHQHPGADRGPTGPPGRGRRTGPPDRPRAGLQAAGLGASASGRGHALAGPRRRAAHRRAREPRWLVQAGGDGHDGGRGHVRGGPPMGPGGFGKSRRFRRTREGSQGPARAGSAARAGPSGSVPGTAPTATTGRSARSAPG